MIFSGTDHRLEAEQRGLTQFIGENAGLRPTTAPSREVVSLEERTLIGTDPSGYQARQNPGGLSTTSLAGSPESMREYLDEYVESGANYFVCSFQLGDLTHDQAMRSIQLFTTEVMPHYMDS